MRIVTPSDSRIGSKQKALTVLIGYGIAAPCWRVNIGVSACAGGGNKGKSEHTPRMFHRTSEGLFGRQIEAFRISCFDKACRAV